MFVVNASLDLCNMFIFFPKHACTLYKMLLCAFFTNICNKVIINKHSPTYEKLSYLNEDKLVKESLKIYTKKVTLSYPETVTTLQRMGNLAWLESKSLNQALTSLTV